jgi:hypothetical protein
MEETKEITGQFLRKFDLVGGLLIAIYVHTSLQGCSQAKYF